MFLSRARARGDGVRGTGALGSGWTVRSGRGAGMRGEGGGGQAAWRSLSLLGRRSAIVS
jgi:hypothetical protein